METYIAAVPVTTVHLITGRGAEHVLHHAHTQPTAFGAGGQHGVGIPIPVETLSWSLLHHDRLGH